MGQTNVYGAGTYASNTVTNISGGSYWTSIPTNMYSATPSSMSRILMSDTSLLRKGMALRYSYYRYTYVPTTEFYGVVSDIATNQYVDIRGVPLDPAKDLFGLAFSTLVSQMDIFVPGKFADTITPDIISNKLNTSCYWHNPDGYIVAMAAKYESGTGSPQINLIYNTEDLWATHLTVSTTWAYATPLVNEFRYGISDGYQFFLRSVSVAASASNLTVSITIVHQ